MNRRAYPSDVSDEEWALVLPYLTLAPLEAPQRKYDLREVFNALRWLVRTGAQWDYLPHDFPPPPIVQAQAYRWMNRGLVHDLRMTLRMLQGRAAHPSAAIYDARTSDARGARFTWQWIRLSTGVSRGPMALHWVICWPW